MFVFLLTATTLYDIMREYRRICCLCSFAVHLRLYRYSSSTRGVSADMTAPQSTMLCMNFSAKRAAPEPSERRATKGFCKRTIFTRKTSGRLSSSEDRLILCYSFFEISRYHLRSEKMCDERLL